MLLSLQCIEMVCTSFGSEHFKNKILKMSLIHEYALQLHSEPAGGAGVPPQPVGRLSWRLPVGRLLHGETQLTDEPFVPG